MNIITVKTNNMTEGNAQNVQLSKTQVLIAKGMGMTIPQLANKYNLSTQQMRAALVDMGITKAEVDEPLTKDITAREQKFLDVCTMYEIETDKLETILSDLGLEYKTGRRSTKGVKKYTIIDDIKTTV